jgi:hypothetical protein
MATLPREPAVGLGRAAIAGLPVYKYENIGHGDGEGDQCAVCLAEIRPEEVVKQLPACTHLFHEGCIDVWLWSGLTGRARCAGLRLRPPPCRPWKSPRVLCNLCNLSGIGYISFLLSLNFFCTVGSSAS